jgi:2-isopropylmalate synthase
MSTEVINQLLSGEIPTDFNWNHQMSPGILMPDTIPAEITQHQASRVQLLSECLRDGLHGVSDYPSASKMIEYVSLLHELGIKTMTVGIFPGEGNKVDRTIKSLLEKMAKQYPDIVPNVLCLATQASLDWLGDCKKINPKLEAVVFIGTAPSRMLVEEWNQDFVLRQMGWAVKEATVKHNVRVIGATEHTTQTPPDFLKKIIQTQVENGAQYFCIADTIGIARPVGAYRIVQFVKQTLKDLQAEHVLVDWHGHDDKGHGLDNALTAIKAGADRVHVVAQGRGERAGNTRMEGILLNINDVLTDAGRNMPYNLKILSKALSLYDEITHSEQEQHGMMSRRAFTTSLGIHAAAIYKCKQLAEEARSLGHDTLADNLNKMSRTIYSAVDPHDVGREFEITISPWSSEKTVRLAYMIMGHDPDSLKHEKIEEILVTAKALGRELTKKEFIDLLDGSNGHRSGE